MRAWSVWAALLASIAPMAVSAQTRAAIPPVPVEGPEFFNPTYVDHQSDATCAGARMTLRWRYTSAGLSVTALTFSGVPASKSELARINGWLSPLRGDALARIECGNEGALISFIDTMRAGGPAPTIKFSWAGGRATLLGSYRLQ